MNKLIPMEFKNQRIMTTKVLAEEFGTEEGNIQKNYSRNEKRFIEGKHYYKLEGQALKEFKNSLPTESLEPIKFAPALYLWTDRGAARHAKILDTDEAWEVYEELEENYFNPKKAVKKLTTEQILELQFRYAKEVKEEVAELKEDFNDFKGNSPLFNIECKELQALVRKVGIIHLGGYKSAAYKDNSLRGRVYADIQHQLKREFGVTRYEAIKRSQLSKARELVKSYILPTVLRDEIIQVNNQVDFEEVI